MLRIKYFESFKNNNPFLVIIARKDDLYKAFNYFSNKKGAYLDASAITDFCDIAPLTHENLFLEEQECAAIAQHFKNLYDLNTPHHAYFDTAALGDQIEILISLGEYDDLF